MQGNTKTRKSREYKNIQRHTISDFFCAIEQRNHSHSRRQNKKYVQLPRAKPYIKHKQAVWHKTDQCKCQQTQEIPYSATCMNSTLSQYETEYNKTAPSYNPKNKICREKCRTDMIDKHSCQSDML